MCTTVQSFAHPHDVHKSFWFSTISTRFKTHHGLLAWVIWGHWVKVINTKHILKLYIIRTWLHALPHTYQVWKLYIVHVYVTEFVLQYMPNFWAAILWDFRKCNIIPRKNNSIRKKFLDPQFLCNSDFILLTWIIWENPCALNSFRSSGTHLDSQMMQLIG